MTVGAEDDTDLGGGDFENFKIQIVTDKNRRERERNGGLNLKKYLYMKNKLMVFQNGKLV